MFRTSGKYGIDTTSTAESYHTAIKILAREEENSRWLKQRSMDRLCHFLLNVALGQFVAREHVGNFKLPENIRAGYRKKLEDYGRLLKVGCVKFASTKTRTTYCTAERKYIMKSAVVEVNDTESRKVETRSVHNLHLLRSCHQRLWLVANFVDRHKRQTLFCQVTYHGGGQQTRYT